jgi:hypothetical protein
MDPAHKIPEELLWTRIHSGTCPSRTRILPNAICMEDIWISAHRIIFTIAITGIILYTTFRKNGWCPYIRTHTCISNRILRCIWIQSCLLKNFFIVYSQITAPLETAHNCFNGIINGSCPQNTGRAFVKQLIAGVKYTSQYSITNASMCPYVNSLISMIVFNDWHDIAMNFRETI